jgi:hypothetical protein
VADVDTTIPAIHFEGIHCKLAMSNEVPLADLEHRPKFGNTGPRRMKQLARQGVENEVNTASIRRVQNLGLEGVVSGVEDALAEYTVMLDKVFDLLGAANGCEYLGADHLTYLNCSKTNAAASRMNEDGLWRGQ